jgi:hypothetical protein
MRRSLSYMHHVVLAAAVVAALGYGTVQAFGTTEQPQSVRTCPAKGFDYPYAACAIGCPTGHGYCSASGICRCGEIP